MGLLQVAAPTNSGGHLIQVTNTALNAVFVIQILYDRKNQDFENWLLNRGWPLNTGPLYTGSTVLCDRYMYESVKVRVPR